MGGRALNGAGLRDMLADDRVWCVLGTVALHEGETEHYEVNDEGDIQVQVVTHKRGVPVTAVLAGSFGSAGGIWSIPAAGDEVLVAFSEGEFEGDAVVVAVTSSRQAPAGLTPSKVYVLGDAVEVRSAGGSAVALATLADVQALREAFNAHVHVLTIAAASGSGGTGTAAPPPPAPAPSGTSVLKGE